MVRLKKLGINTQMKQIHCKICGLRTREAVRACADGGADFIGFVLFEKSSRNISPEKIPPLLADLEHPKTVAVMVNPTDEYIEAMLEHFTPDYIQLHGDETPERVREVQKYAKVIKAISVANKADIERAVAYEGVADMLLFDTKDTKEYGGTGRAFDWGLIADFSSDTPWFLSGGLNIDNINEAIQTTHAKYIDVSSGVEKTKGVKDIAKIEALLEKTGLTTF